MVRRDRVPDRQKNIMIFKGSLNRATWFRCAFLALLALGCRPDAPRETALEPSPVAVLSPYLESALVEILGPDAAIVRLASPGMCPGHCDLRPSQIKDFARCGVLVRFDFQAPLERKLNERVGGSRQTLAVSVPGGLCVPDSYLLACRRIAEHFTRAGSLDQREAKDRLTRLEQRLAALHKEAAAAIASRGLQNTPVLASGHQADFCRWLGLRVVGEISSADESRIGAIEQSIQAAEAAGVKIIVANEPEGRRLADALADRLAARVVMFGNFPAADGHQTFDALVHRNVAALLAAAPATLAEPP